MHDSYHQSFPNHLRIRSNFSASSNRGEPQRDEADEADLRLLGKKRIRRRFTVVGFVRNSVESKPLLIVSGVLLLALYILFGTRIGFYWRKRPWKPRWFRNRKHGYYKMSSIGNRADASWHNWDIESGQLAHDDPKHPLHWMREKLPPKRSEKDCNSENYRELYDHYHKYGYVIFRSCTLSNETLGQVTSFTRNLLGRQNRKQDAWKYNEHVRDLGVDQDLLEFLEYLHGNSRRVYPFQTLNFPVGTQQPLHSDVVHFDSLPERCLMVAAWTALEDMNSDKGPLTFFSGSHQFGVWDYDELAIYALGEESTASNKPIDIHSWAYSDFLYSIYEKYLEDVLPNTKLERKYSSSMKQGETLIWAPSLVHGGSPVKDPKSTRLSQVTHYYFDGAEEYWIPRRSDPVLDSAYMKGNQPICDKDGTLLDPLSSLMMWGGWNSQPCADRFLNIWYDQTDAMRLWGHSLI